MTKNKRILGITHLPIDSLIEAEYNPRQLKKEQYRHLKDSLSRFGFVDPVLVNTHPDRQNIIIGGHQRVKVARDLGYTEVPCVELSLTLDQEKELNIRLNKNTGEWDMDALANYFDTQDLMDWGFAPEELSFFGEELEAKEDDYEVPDEIETDIVSGDLFEIGQHRLLCGSSTEADAVIKLLNGKEPYLMVTDPPYGVKYDANWRNEADRANGKPYGARAIGKVQNDDKADWTEAWALSPAKVAYVWHAGRHAATVQTSLEACDFEMRSQIIWHKNNIVISRGDYHWKHEPCWYAVKKGSKGNWAGDRKQTTVWDIPKPLKSETGHSTQKPVECMSRAIANHDGDVHDPFLGSGTTMVAAHQLNRKCYGMELDPKYCQVIVDRMRKLDPSIEIKRNGHAYTKA